MLVDYYIKETKVEGNYSVLYGSKAYSCSTDIAFGVIEALKEKGLLAKYKKKAFRYTFDDKA